MGLRYLETSALVKLYVEEPGSDAMLHMVRAEEGHKLALLSLSRVEFVSALRRRARSGDLTIEMASTLEEMLERHLSTRFLVQLTSERIIDEAVSILRKYPLRAYDAVQLAGALVMRENASSPNEKPVFVCADQELLEAAAAEGLDTFNPAEQVS